jgi:ParB family chromosome partitioning protein
MDEGALASLSASISRRGMMQPIVVRERGGEGARYELVAGERRWRAARMAGLERVPALVAELTDEEAAELAIVENVQREDLNPVDRARGLRALGERFGLSHGAIAERVGLERSSVTNLIRVTELEEEILSLLAKGVLSLGHGKALLGLAGGRGRVELAARAVRGSWSVRELERRVGSLGGGASPGGGGSSGVAKPAGVVDLERRLGEHLGTGVRIRTAGKSGSKGTIEVSFYDFDHFDGLMRRMGLGDRL